VDSYRAISNYGSAEALPTTVSDRLISAYQRINTLEERNRSLAGKVARLVQANTKLRVRVRVQKQELKDLRATHRYAIQQLAKKRPDILSDEEWRLVLESRGIC
jgi:predicted  nucleic acid-binding Zn-ribbon protein